MDVFLIPTGRAAYELYYEPADDSAAVVEEPAGGGLFSTWRKRFTEMLREAELERHRGSGAPEPEGLLARAQRRMMRFVAERIAEWRLLWHLRGADDLIVHVPADMSEDEARQRIKALLKHDADRHLRWMLINLLLLAASAPLMFVPGPNVLGYYFTFNVVGQFLALRGARRGLGEVPWRVVPTPALTDLRAALALDERQRARTVHDVAARLHLQHLARFFERIAVPTA